MSIYNSEIGVSGITLFVVAAILVFIHVDRSKSFRAVHFSILSMGTIYGLGFPLIYSGIGNVYFVGAEFISNSKDYLYIHTVSSLIAIIFVLYGWGSISTNTKTWLSSKFRSISHNSIKNLMFVMLLISIVSQYLYTKDYGGFIGYFDFNRIIRSGMLEDYQRSKFSFLQPFGDFAVVSCFGFFGLILSRFRSLSIWIGFVTSLAFSAYVLFAASGRVAMVSFLAVFILSIILKNRFNYYILYIGYFIMIIFGTSVIFIISNIFEIKSADNIYEYIVREFSFPFTSFFAQLNRGNLFHLFHDVILSPAYLIPSSLTSNWLLDASDYNTVVIMGSKKGEFGVTGAVPTDILTFGLMQFGFIGIIIYSYMFGKLLRILSILAGSFSISGIRYVSTSYVNIYIGIFAIFYAQPKHVILSNFSVICVLLFIFSAGFIKRNSLSKYRSV